MILVDSDVIIAHLRGVEAAREWLVRTRRSSGPLRISAVAIAEVACGIRSAERREVSRLLATMKPIPVTERIAWKAADFMRTFRRSHTGIGLGDYLVAATADIEGLQLATLNVKHFPMFSDLEPPFSV